MFDDTKHYYREDPATSTYYGVKVPNNGVKIKVGVDQRDDREGQDLRLSG